MATAVSIDGTSLYFEESGRDGADGPPVVLVHGITESAEAWRPIAERLSANHRVIAIDLRGHGRSGMAERYDLEAMAGDVVAVAREAELQRPHLVGHSLGGAVVSAVGAVMPVSSVVNVDQSLQLGSFKESLDPLEQMLRDPASFGSVIEGLFAELVGTKLPTGERERIAALRCADQGVVLGVWELLFSMTTDEISGVVEGALAGFQTNQSRYLSLFGIDPGPEYEGWLQRLIPAAIVELWGGHGHYPHLVEPDRFVSRLENFWR